MAPLALYLDYNGISQVLVKVRPENMQSTVAQLENTFAELSPDYPFVYQFLDDAYNRMYQTEIRLGGLFSYLTTLAILIACLGLLGLASFTVSQRTKEIGVRKVLGATHSDILVMLSRDYTRLVLIAIVIGTPIAYYGLNTWLQDFAYSVSLGWGTLALAGMLAILLAWITVGYQSVKAALADPIDSLRYE